MPRDKKSLRPPHKYMQPVKERRPEHCIFFDSESHVSPDGLHTPYLIWACFWDNWKQNWLPYKSNSPDVGRKFWNHVSDTASSAFTLYVYAHNAEYDLLVTRGISHLANNGFRVKSWFAKGSVFILDFEGPEGEKIRILSTTNYYAGTLKDLGNAVGLEKIDVDVLNITEEQAMPYCKRDAEIIVKAMEDYFTFIDENEYGSVMSTISGQAFHIFKKKFMHHDIFVHSHEKVIELERAAYMGGRVECFQIGRLPGRIYCLDVNSMYPYVMSITKVPVKYLTARKCPSIKDIAAWIAAGYCLVAEVEIRTEEPDFPKKLEDKLIFPVGEFTTSLCTPELSLALKKGAVIRCNKAAIYEGEIIFDTYIAELYEKRKQEKNPIKNKTLKLFLNGLYGKFGQQADEWDPVEEADPLEISVEEVFNNETKRMETYKTFGGTRFFHAGLFESYDSFAAIAAHVTSAARCVLQRYINAAERADVYYCDTDSLFVSEDARIRLANHSDSTALGRLKVEKISDEVYLYAPKDYRFLNNLLEGDELGKNFIRQKGVKRGAKALDDTNTKWEQDQWPKLAGMLRKGDISTYRTLKMVKNLSRAYNKGTVNPDGKVLPIRLTK